MKRVVTAGLAAVLSLALASCQMAGPGKEYLESREDSGKEEREETSGQEQGQAQEPEQENAPEQEEKQEGGQGTDGDQREDSGDGAPVMKAAGNLGMGNELVTGRFFKAGGVHYGLFFVPERDSMESEGLRCIFTIPQDQRFSCYDSAGEAVITTENGKGTYEILPGPYEDNPKVPPVPYQITFATDHKGNPRVSLEGDGGLAGDYYLFKESFTYPDVFLRYLGKADLCMWPAEDLGLLRNEIYAANGRKFSSDDLNRYFSAREWYRGVIEPGDFTDSLLSDVERKNIKLIQEMEEELAGSQTDGRGKLETEELTPAPYLPYLGRYEETGLGVDLSEAMDMGAYYVAPGAVYLPAVITRQQYQTVLDGGETEVVLNELTGDSMMLTRNPEDDVAYHFLLYAKGGDPLRDGGETGSFLDYSTGEYQLWQTSADTVMKVVYTGDIYIMKGAVEGADVSVELASGHQREILPAGDGQKKADEYDSGAVWGNHLCYNEQGYITAMYSLGD